MQFIKVLLWVLFLVGGFIFWWTNESRSSLDLGIAIVEARVSTFTLGALLIGLLPTWLLLRGARWRLMRRIRTLEAAARPAPVSSPTPSPTAKEAPLDSAKKPVTKPKEAEPAVSLEPEKKA